MYGILFEMEFVWVGVPSWLNRQGWVQLDVLVGLVEEVREGLSALSVTRWWLQRAEALTLSRGLSRHGVAGPLLFNNVRTTIVRCGHLGLDGTFVKPLQQVPMDGPLVVPLATLDSELQPVK